MLGKSLADGIMESITQGLDGFKYLKNGENFTDNTNHTSSNTNSSSSNNSSVSSAVDNIVNEVVKQETTSSKKGKVTATNLNVREDAGTNNRVIGSVYKGEEVQILSEKDGWYNINYWSDVYKKNRQGWVSGAYIQKFHTGGIVGDIKRNDEGLAIVQSGERILSKSQTDIFEDFTGWLPNFNSMVKSINNLNTNRQVRPSSNVTFNNNYEVTNKTEFDVKSNMETMAYRQKQQLRRAGVI